MERLTERVPNDGKPFYRFSNASGVEVRYRYCIGIERAVDRLAAYEDTDKTPEELAEWVKADQEGRLVVLPCKVGDMVYVIERDYDEETGIPECYVEEYEFDYDMLESYGSDIFQTREKAVAQIEQYVNEAAEYVSALKENALMEESKQ